MELIATFLEKAWHVMSEAWHVMSEMAPYLLFGFSIAGILSVLIRPETVEKHLGGRSLLSVLKASLFGVPLPLCSCGVIPVAASLKRHGASSGATTAFLLSTPQTGVDSIFVTLSLLGPLFAIFRPLAALATGLIGGTLVNSLAGEEDARNGAEPESTSCSACGAPPEKARGIYGAIRYGFVFLPRDIGKPLILGLLAAGIISAVVPNDYFAGLLGGGLGAMVLMMLIGLPVYVCATASVPIALTLILKGVSPGAALVFLMTGPATNAAAVATIWKVLGRKTTTIYLLTVSSAALASGLILDSLFAASGRSAEPGMVWMMPGPVKIACALLLLGLLMNALLRPLKSEGKRPQKESAASERGDRIFLRIKGMTCSHCSSSITRSLSECEGVTEVQVDLKRGHAVVEGKSLNTKKLIQAIEGLGFRIGDGVKKNREQ